MIFAALLTLLLMFFLMGYTDIPVKQFRTSINNLPVRTIPADFDPSNVNSLNAYVHVIFSLLFLLFFDG